MKKLLDSKFLFIVALSLVVLIILGVGAFYLFDDKDDTFARKGYVINPLSAKVEKYFFDKDTPYKENLSSMIVFKDVDNKNASILKDSFLHYNDGSLSFLSNGAILDLDTINGSEAVNFYNITSASLIEKKGDRYVIENSSDDIYLKNFIGRISENKYIVVGNIEAQIPGNEKNISGDYFEIVYSEKGIVNIENKDVKFQVTAEGTVLHIGSITIDLGAKKISKNGEDVMSLTSITINGDENIEIIPQVEEEEKENEGENGTGTNNGTGEVAGTGNQNEGTSEGGTGNENTDIDTTQDIIVSLKSASIGSTSVDVTFDMYNTVADDNFSLKVTNLVSGRTVDMIDTVRADEEIRINLLSPSTKYLFTVTNDRDGNKYFQKIFQTNDFGIKLEKTYATDSELGFKVTVDKDTDISNAKLSLYKYNEETKKNEVVTTSYYDNITNETKYNEKVTYLSSSTGNIGGVHEIVYDGLDSNTIYTAVLDEFSLVSVNFKDVYNITETAITLKKAPEFSDMIVEKDVGTGTFKLALKDILDKDNSIESYTYKIYELDNPNETVIDPIFKTNASPIEIKIGDKENQLKNDINYFYKIIIEYFDNEKYVEYILDDTINFVMGSDPYITVVPNDAKISYDKIGATIHLIDNSCLISMPGREKCLGVSSTRINVTTIKSGGIEYVYSNIVDFDVSDDDIKYELEVDGLQEGTTYTVEVEAIRNDKLDAGSQVLLQTDESRKNITTKTLTNFTAEWVDKGSSANHVVNLQTKFIADGSTGTLGPDDSAASIKKVVAKLYNGSYAEDLTSQTPIATKSFVNTENFNLKDRFYDHGFNMTSDDTFGLDVDGLKAKNNGSLSEYYTIAIYAYYDEDGTNEVMLINNITSYKVNPAIDIDQPEIYVESRTKGVSEIQSNLVNSGTIAGYMVTGGWNSSALSRKELTPTGINIYVYNDKGQRVNFFVKDGNNLSEVSSIENASVNASDSSYSTEIYMGYGTDYYSETDTVMSRGNNYYIGYQLILEGAMGTILYPSNLNEVVPTDFGMFSELIKTEKETPTVTMYIAKSTATSITYRYTVKDPDNALYKEENANTYGYYYTINDGTEAKLSLTKDETVTQYNAFKGELTINGLDNGDVYNLYYKKNATKTGVFDTDVLKYFDGTDNGKRVFDGYYDALAETAEYNFKYEVINPTYLDENNNVEYYDNKVTVKMLASDEILDRIVNYELTFTDSKDTNNSNKLVKNMWKLETCPGDSEGAKPRCLSVDYVELKNHGMKSTTDNEHVITVNVKAFYDNGLTGYDFIVDTSNNIVLDDHNEKKYMIFQNNLIPGETPKYVSFTKADTLAIWSEENDIGKGYYTFEEKTAAKFTYKSVLRNKHLAFNYSLTASGYSTKYGILNPKMVSKQSMSCENKTFSFYSITPKVKIEKTVNIINGAVVNLSLSGADIEDFCEEGNVNSTCVNNNNSDFYVYIDVWQSSDYASANNRLYLARPTVKVKINKQNPSESVRAVIDGLRDGMPYYYNVYTYLNRNGGHPVYTQLCDFGVSDDYQVKTYRFNTLEANDLYHSFSVDVKPNLNGDYNDKLIDTKINLVSYANNVPFNFDVGYAFCENGDTSCGVGENNTWIFKNVIPKEDVKTVTTGSVDISDADYKDDIEFGKSYYMVISALYDYYYKDPETNEFAIKKIPLPLNQNRPGFQLRKLETPEFTVEREAVLIPGTNNDPPEYAIDFTINANDFDRVLDDGKYYVALKYTDINNNTTSIVGNLQIMNNGNWSTVSNAFGDYDDYAFDATVLQQQIRITGLEPDSRYTIEVYNMAYINNYDENVPVSERNYRIDKSFPVYSTNSAGVAFGKELIYNATANSFVIKFMGGSNFDNVRQVGYTVARWGQNAGDFAYSGCYDVGPGIPNSGCQGTKQFKPDQNTGYWKFVIDDERIKNDNGEIYYIALSFKVINGEDEYNYYGDDYEHPITSNPITNPEFFGRASYDEDDQESQD